jgi:23S rRNA (guanosine2251-2'-O)-methyltransferase
VDQRGPTGHDSPEWLYGVAPVEEALRAGRRRVREIWVASHRRDSRMRSLLSLARGLDVHRTNTLELSRLSRGGNHQGVVALVDPFPWEELEDLLWGRGPLVMLEGVQDPRNLGAILRSSVGMGAARVIMERRHSAPLTPVVAKAACGALEYVRMCAVSNLPMAMREVKRVGYWILGTSDSQGSVLWDADIPGEVAVVVGGEGSGLRRVVKRACDMWVRIPSEGAISTYNASVAAAVVLYELMRRRRPENVVDKAHGGS